ncbi:L-threonylcarbamoyladenylate synthase [Streptomyces sp. NPDC012794]|uniref:L-threonylcarbamoyladenylate synthase n=1 Tax=Streptomyces sp. NPDC012794 TaxID=3364850 RepID=UPI0036D1ADEC
MNGQRTRTNGRRLVLDDAEDVRAAAGALAEGCAVAHGFGNLYAVTAGADRAAVERVSRLKGRPEGQVASVTTVRERVLSLFDWSRVPAALPRRQLGQLVEELFLLGPFGFRGPAAAHVPRHLTEVRDGVATVRLVGPGYRCPSNGFLAEALERTGGALLSITSVNLSRHLTGAEHEPAHWRAEGVVADFGHRPDVRILVHDDEPAARRRYPHHAPTPATVLSFHHAPGRGRSGLPALTLERHGSLSADHTRAIAANHGFALVSAPRAGHRLPARAYAD